ncbi:hypothetical protein D3C85_1051570 [compost metagenome]
MERVKSWIRLGNIVVMLKIRGMKIQEVHYSVMKAVCMCRIPKTSLFVEGPLPVVRGSWGIRVP